MTSQEYLELSSQKNWKYNMVIKNPVAINLEFIHPLKQELVNVIVGRAIEDINVKKLIVFGSSITSKCNPFSDLDICIDWKIRSHDDDGVYVLETNAFMKFISLKSNGNVDILSYDDIENQSIKEAVDGGIVVYEHNV